MEAAGCVNNWKGIEDILLYVVAPFWLNTHNPWKTEHSNETNKLDLDLELVLLKQILSLKEIIRASESADK